MLPRWSSRDKRDYGLFIQHHRGRLPRLSHKVANVKCETCHQLFHRKKSAILRHVYCSRRCTINGQRREHVRMCHSCGRPFRVMELHRFKRERVFCSRQCQFAYGRVTHPCYYCNNLVTRERSRIQRGRHTFCSRRCFELSQTREGLLTRKCLQCGQSFRKKRAEIRRKHKDFCSTGCYIKWNRGRNHSWFGKRRRIRWPLYSYNGKTFRSSWEVRLATWLDSKKISWLYEPTTFDLGWSTYTPDFYLPTPQKYIEVKGFMTEVSARKISDFRRLHPLIVVDATRINRLDTLLPDVSMH